MSKKARVSLIVIISILVIDQIIKFLVKTNMYLGDEIPVFDHWFLIHFTENNGMAFGWELKTSWGKLALSLFRLFAIGFIAYYLISIIKKNYPTGYIVTVSMILAGASGNLIDSIFYGKLFSESGYYKIAEFLPSTGGYAGFLHGKVVDMFYFPIISTTWPDWVPFVGGEKFVFFQPVFNFADASITVGFFILLIFYNKYIFK
jgi:signal peptidase II